MVYAEVKQDGTINQVWHGIADPDFNPPLLPDSTLMSWPDGTDVRPGMVWDGKKLIMPKPDLKLLKENAKSNILSFLNSKNKFKKYSEIEEKSFPYKLQAAKAYLNKSADEYEKQILEEEAKDRKISIKKLAEKIVQKNLEFTLFSSKLSALRKNAFTEIEKAKSEKTLQKIINKYQEEIKKI